jgi:hypothetical protein
MKELFEIKVGSMTMGKYERRFLKLLKYVDYIKDEKVTLQRYLSGIPSIFSDKIQYDAPKTLDETIRIAKCLYDQHRGRPTFQKAWEDKNKGKIEKMKKGTKPPFFKNNSQGQTNSNEPRMTETMGKIPRKQLMKCLGYEGDHMYMNFPHRSKKVRTIHNIQQSDTVEDIGKKCVKDVRSLG